MNRVDRTECVTIPAPSSAANVPIAIDYFVYIFVYPPTCLVVDFTVKTKQVLSIYDITADSADSGGQ